MKVINLRKPYHAYDAAMICEKLKTDDSVICESLEVLDMLLQFPQDLPEDIIFKSGEKTFDLEMMTRLRFERGFEVRS